MKLAWGRLEWSLSLVKSSLQNLQDQVVYIETMYVLFSLFSMTPLGNAKNVVLSRCCLLINMTNGQKLLYY